MGIKLVSWDDGTRELVVYYPGSVLAAFFKDYIDRNGQNINPNKPVSQQQFFSDYFVAGARKKSEDADTALVEKLDVVQLNNKRDITISSISGRWETKIAGQEAVLGQALRQKREAHGSPQAEAAAKTAEAAEATLATMLSDKAEELAAASRRWDGLVEKRTAFDAKVAAARAKAQAAVEVGQQRKAAKTAASEEFARQQLASAQAMGAAAGDTESAAEPATAPNPAPPAAPAPAAAVQAAAPPAAAAAPAAAAGPSNATTAAISALLAQRIA